MTTHKKHEDIEHVQIRTKILDMYGNPIQGAIEYDPKTGYGKRIKLGQEKEGIIEPFYAKDGSLEIDGNNFDDTNHDVDKVDAIKTLIALKVNRNQPEYDDILAKHVDNVRKEKEKQKQAKQQQEQQPMVGPGMAALVSAAISNQEKTFIASQRIDEGQRVSIDFNQGTISPIKENIPDPDKQRGESITANAERQAQEREARLAARETKA